MTQARSKEHDARSIAHHYDVSNDFYALFLDPLMVYTCAYFAEPSFTLEQAQVAKLDHVCRKLQLAPQQTVVEAGCAEVSFLVARVVSVPWRASESFVTDLAESALA